MTPTTPAAPGIGMSQSTAETWVIVAAVTVAGIYAYRRVTDPTTAPGKLKNVAGSGTPVPTGQFVTAWGCTFLIVSIMVEADPGLGGGFALLILAADLLTNAQSVFSNVATAETVAATGKQPAAASKATAGAPAVQPSSSRVAPTGGTIELPQAPQNVPTNPGVGLPSLP